MHGGMMRRIVGRAAGRVAAAAVAAGVLFSDAKAAEDQNGPLPEIMSPFSVDGQGTEGFVGLRFTGELSGADCGEGAFVMSSFVLGDGTTAELLLEPMQLTTEDARLVIGTRAGDRPAAMPNVALYSGQVVGKADSRVFLSLSEGAQYGYVIVDGATHVLSSGPAGQGLPPVIYRTDAVPEDAFNWADWTCSVGASERVEAVGVADSGREETAGGEERPPCRVAVIAVETDWEYTGSIFGGNTEASAAYALTLWGAVSEIYKRDVNTSLRISFLRVWESDSDPYAGGGLGEFQNYWNANMGHVPRHAAHILCAGYGGGVAYLPGLCNWGYEYGLSGALAGYFPYPLRDHSNYNWDPFVVSHELGHNFGAPHTHDHNPVIDGCGLGDCSDAFNGTIMSYCHGCPRGMFNIVLRLHERSISEAILPWLRRANCDLTVDPECAITCGDVKKMTARCSARGQVSLKVRLRNEDHNGQEVVVNLDGRAFAFTVRGDRVAEKVCCFAGPVTVSLESPSGCVPPIETPCE